MHLIKNNQSIKSHVRQPCFCLQSDNSYGALHGYHRYNDREIKHLIEVTPVCFIYSVLILNSGCRKKSNQVLNSKNIKA